MLVDSHCHLDFDDFSNDFSDVLANAKSNNVGVLQTICTKISEFDKIEKIVGEYNHIYGSVGIHPHEVDNEDTVSAKRLIDLSSNPKIIGIGETGLDYFYDHSDRVKQRSSFIKHIEAARETGLPIIIHTREADDDTIKILEDEMKKGFFKALIHCFTSTQKLADHCLDLGMYISVSGIVTFKNAKELQEIIKKIPLSRLLIETDAPYLSPVPKRGQRNEPAFVAYTAKFLAELKNVSYEEVEQVTTRNFFELFSKAKQCHESF